MTSQSLYRDHVAMFRSFALAVLCTFYTTTASAGCSNYEDGSLPGIAAPLYRICYDEVCDDTTLSYECSNVSGAQQGFANGWALDYSAIASGEVKLTVTWQGRTIDESKHHRLVIEEIENWQRQ